VRRKSVSPDASEHMHMKSLAAAALALSLLVGSLTNAHADGRDHNSRHYDQHDRHDRGHHQDRHDDDRHGKDWNKVDSHDRGYRQGRYDAGRYVGPRGYHHYTWRRGDRVPAAYRANRYVVRNYSVYRLRSPPRGHHWVRVDRDVVLTAIATGIVVQVVDGLFH
jgi:Ni/Co efflux regulator RcnB